MSAPNHANDRRRFLQGSGGALLALPLLPSLFTPAEVKAQSARRRCLIVYQSSHGGVAQSSFFPSLPANAATMEYAGHSIRRAPLVGTADGADMRVSAIVRAPSDRLTAGLLGKANLLNGVSPSLNLMHNRSMGLGNFGEADSGEGAVKGTHTRTIDQLLAWSPNFYTDLTGVRERAIVVGNQSYNYSDPANRSGAIERVAGSARGSREMFDKLFGTNSQAADTPLLVDAVVEDYRALREGNRRLSAEDRRRLDDHMQRLSELQRRLRAQSTGAPIARPNRSSSDFDLDSDFNRLGAKQIEYHTLWNDVVVAAFSAGASRVASISTWLWGYPLREGSMLDFAGDFHGDIAHMAEQRGAQHDTLVLGHHNFFRYVFLDLVNKMEAVDVGGGRTLLDESLAVWNHECGNVTHFSFSTPIMTFGSAGGVFRTGQYCDYRNLATRLDWFVKTEGMWRGLLWQQWLGTVLQAMGISKAEYEQPSVCGGYPPVRFEQTGLTYSAGVWNATTEWLPWLRA